MVSKAHIIVSTTTEKNGGVNMANDTLGMLIPKDEQEEIKEFISTIILLPKEDRAVLLSNANALRVRRDLEKANTV